jgi:hypothetical protein
MLPSLDLPKLKASQDGITSTAYLSIVGSCLHICQVSRPDCAFAVGVLARHSATPGAVHWDAALDLVKYMYSTRNWSIRYSRSSSTKPNNPTLFEQSWYSQDQSHYHEWYRVHGVDQPGLPTTNITPRTIEDRLLTGKPLPLPNVTDLYCDADHAGDRVTRRSTSGFIAMMNGGPISWSSRLQKLCAQSSAESEIYAVTDSAKEALHLKLLCEESGIRPPGIPMTIWEDNNACIHLGHNLRGSKAAKHFELRLRLRNEHIWEKNIEFSRIDTKEQLADPFTKPLPLPAFRAFRDIMMNDRPNDDSPSI